MWTHAYAYIFVMVNLIRLVYLVLKLCSHTAHILQIMQSVIEAGVTFEDTDVIVNGRATFSIFVLVFLVGSCSSVMLL